MDGDDIVVEMSDKGIDDIGVADCDGSADALNKEG